MEPDNTQTPPESPPPAPESPPPTAPPVSWAKPEPVVVPGAAGFVYGDVPNRIFALIIDAIVLLVIASIIGVVLGIAGLSAGYFQSSAGTTSSGAGLLVFAVVGALINALYFIFFWTRSRATPGMRALGLQVGNAFDGKTLTTNQAVRRAVALWGPTTVAQFLNSVSGIGSILSLLALIWVVFLLYSTAKSPSKQGWHDKFANSVVVKAARTV
jgi:uncharacterized RDD family membrane protein YckC